MVLAACTVWSAGALYFAAPASPPVRAGLAGCFVLIGMAALAALFMQRWRRPALAVFLGHLYPIYHRFKGGKGVATTAGIAVALHWPLGLTLFVVWAVMALGFKISSLAALTAAVLLPLGGFYVFGNALTAWATVAIALLLFWRHRANIEKLFAGKESTIGR